MTATDATTQGRVYVSKAGPLTFMGVGVIGAAVAIGWALLVWHFDELISPRGQITVAVTTPCVMFFFLGLLGYWRANDRERQADRIDALKTDLMEEWRAELAEQAANLAADHARRELRLMERIERLQDQLTQVTVAMAEVSRLCRPKPSTRRRKTETVPTQPAAAHDGAHPEWALDMAAEAFRLGRQIGPEEAA